MSFLLNFKNTYCAKILEKLPRSVKMQINISLTAFRKRFISYGNQLSAQCYLRALPHAGRLYVCTIKHCGQTFSERWRLNRHVTSCSNGTLLFDFYIYLLNSYPKFSLAAPKPVACDQPGCSTRFREKWELTRHKNRVHKPLPTVCCSCHKDGRETTCIFAVPASRKSNGRFIHVECVYMDGGDGEDVTWNCGSQDCRRLATSHKKDGRSKMSVAQLLSPHCYTLS